MIPPMNRCLASSWCGPAGLPSTLCVRLRVQRDPRREVTGGEEEKDLGGGGVELDADGIYSSAHADEMEMSGCL